MTLILTFSPLENGPLFSPSHTVRKSIDLLSHYLPSGRDARIRQSGSNRERENHNHLFFLNHHTVNPVASNVIAIAISYPVLPFELMDSLEIHPIPGANNH